MTFRRGTGRVGVGKSARERRIFQARGEQYTLGDSLRIGTDGRLEINLPSDSDLQIDQDGIRLKESSLGEDNYAPMGPIAKLSDTATNQNIIDKVNELIAELIRTRRSRA